MLRFDDIKHIYLATQSVDLRKGISGYAIMVKEVLGKDPYDDSLYIFTNSHHNKIKCLYYDGTSFWLLYKRLEKGTFKWIKKADGSSVLISHQQLKWLLEGLTIYQEKAFKETKYKYVYNGLNKPKSHHLHMLFWYNNHMENSKESREQI